VVGGSIAGCSLAVELSRAGHDVTVFEREAGELVGRGAGIGTPTSTMRLMTERDLVDIDLPHFALSRHVFNGRDDAGNSHVALTLALDMAVLNWGDLWRSLRRRVPDSAYRAASQVVEVVDRETAAPTLRLADGTTETFDLVIFADGYRSIGRAALFPDAELRYLGYVLWRGVLEERDLADAGPLEDTLFRRSYKGLPGTAVCYFVPGRDGSTAAGERWVNWACYIPLPEDGLPGFLVDRDGRQRQGALPPGAMRCDEEDRLRSLMRAHLPDYFGEIICASADTVAQPIFMAEIPAYLRGRICLAGDAGALMPPFTGSGVFKAMNDAVHLAEALSREGPVETALARWSERETETGRRLAALARQMDEAFVWRAPDFGTMAEADTAAWWAASVTFPEGFRYARDN
jgi:2-polyprenyl-6-methoxyphenol hydroxylase-like FAD-dependent oxidoreductase